MKLQFIKEIFLKIEMCFRILLILIFMISCSESSEKSPKKSSAAEKSKQTSSSTQNTISTTDSNTKLEKTKLTDSSGKATTVVGEVRRTEEGKSDQPHSDWMKLAKNDPINATDYVSTEKRSKTHVDFSAIEYIVGPSTELQFLSLISEDDEEYLTTINTGSAHISVDKLSSDQKLSAITPNLVVGVRGTTFYLEASAKQTNLVVLEGVVEAQLNISYKISYLKNAQNEEIANSLDKLANSKISVAANQRFSLDNETFIEANTAIEKLLRHPDNYKEIDLTPINNLNSFAITTLTSAELDFIEKTIDSNTKSITDDNLSRIAPGGILKQQQIDSNLDTSLQIAIKQFSESQTDIPADESTDTISEDSDVSATEEVENKPAENEKQDEPKPADNSDNDVVKKESTPAKPVNSRPRHVQRTTSLNRQETRQVNTIKNENRINQTDTDTSENMSRYQQMQQMSNSAIQRQRVDEFLNQPTTKMAESFTASRSYTGFSRQSSPLNYPRAVGDLAKSPLESITEAKPADNISAASSSPPVIHHNPDSTNSRRNDGTNSNAGTTTLYGNQNDLNNMGNRANSANSSSNSVSGNTSN